MHVVLTVPSTHGPLKLWHQDLGLHCMTFFLLMMLDEDVFIDGECRCMSGP